MARRRVCDVCFVSAPSDDEDTKPAGWLTVQIDGPADDGTESVWESDLCPACGVAAHKAAGNTGYAVGMVIPK